MNFIPLIILVLTLLAIAAFYCCYRHQTKRQYARRQNRPSHRARRIHYSIAPLAILGGLSILFMLSLIAYCSYAQFHDSGDPSPPATATPAPEESQPVDPGTTSQPIKSVSELFPDFHLSMMEDSELLKLSGQMIQGDALTFDLISDAEEQFKVFLATKSHPISFFPYYNGLENYFPAGGKVTYAFDDVVNREQCNAQLRGAGERLDEAKNGSSIDSAQIVKASHQMAVRALDAMGFTKYPEKQAEIEIEPETNSQKKWHIWLYAEIFLPSQLNSYIYDQSNDTDSYAWYYSFAQVFDYLGGIADNKELEVEMYFSSAVFLHRTFKLMEENNFQVTFEDNDHKKWELYVEMLYRVAARGEPSDREDFFQEIQRVENAVSAQPFSEEIQSSMAKTLNTLDLYTEWRGAE